jgi:hypothetical protein
MQTRFRFSFLVAFAAILLFASCSKKNKSARYIPKTAAMVMHVNGETINSKLPWNEVKQNSLFQELYADTSMDAFVKAALDNPESTGIDVKNDLFFFATKDSIGGYTALQGSVKDADKFKSFFGNVSKTTAVTEKEGISSLASAKMITSWNKDRFIILFDAPQMNAMNKMNMPMSPMDSLTPQAQPSVPRDLGATAAGIFALKEENSLVNDSRFSDLMNTKGDFHFWMNIGALNVGDMNMGPLSSMNLNKVYDSSAFAATATFLDGRISVDAKSYANKEMSDLFKKYSGSGISQDMVKRLPSKDVAFLFAMNFKPQGILEFVKIMGMDGLASMGLAQLHLGFTLDDFIKANKGDIVIAVSDVHKDSLGKTDVNFLFSASVNDKVAFGKLIEAGKMMSKNFTKDTAKPPFFYNSNDNIFALGSKQETVDKYIQSANNSSFDFLNDISGDPIALYINFQSFIRAGAKSGDSLSMQTYDASLKMWDNLIAHGGNFKDGGLVQHADINLVDKQTNSLKQLNNYLGTMGIIHKKIKAMHANSTDTTTLAVDSAAINR